MRKLALQNAEQGVRISHLQTEVEDTRAQLQQAAHERDHALLLSSRSEMQASATIKALEAEKEILVQQVNRLQQELGDLRQRVDQLLGRQHDSQRSSITLESEKEELNQKLQSKIKQIELQ